MKLILFFVVSDLMRFDERLERTFRESPPTIDAIAKSLIEQFDPSVRKRMEEALSEAYIRLTNEDPVELLFQMANGLRMNLRSPLRISS